MGSSPEHSAGSSSRRQQSVWRKLTLLMWKNLVLRRRHWLLTAFEILLPTLLFTLIVTIRVLPDSTFIPHYVDENTTFPIDTELYLRYTLCGKYGVWNSHTQTCETLNLPQQWKIFYGPDRLFTRKVASHLANSIGLYDSNLEAVSSIAEMDMAVDKAYFQTNQSWATFFVGLFFHDLGDKYLPRKLNYDLRMSKIWLTQLTYPYFQIPGPRYFNLLGDIQGTYTSDGFTLLQSIVDRYYISQLSGNDDYITDYKIGAQMYPYPPYMQDNGVSQIYGSLLPTFVVLSLVLLSPSLIKSVVHEKDTGVRELIRLMGLDAWLVWLGWFLHSFGIIIVVSSVMTFLMKLQLMPTTDGTAFLPPILAHSDAFFVWVLLLLYGVSSIAFCFAISTFFNKPTLATTMGILLWLCSYFIPSAIMYGPTSYGLADKLLSCLLPNMAITWAFSVIGMFEGRSIGVQWDNLWQNGSPREELTMGMILLMLVLDTLLFLLVMWYVDQVSPGKYGVPRPFYFPFQRSYWCGSRPDDSMAGNPSSVPEEHQYFEEDPEGLKPGIVIRNLRKEFRTLGGKVKVAVENVSMTCYEGQCTVLLGHNGAGKTTTMSVLTGVHAPTGGQAEVGGWNIATHLREARMELGLCPQHNMLFGDLTVLQHLLFFGRLKGLAIKAAREEAEVLMGRLDLLQKKHKFGKQLSGGMKRKLSLAISLIGGSKVVVLDEPTSGLDPESRRRVWDVVQGERGRRTILVTTHHMEEADVLGDRVVIMATGKVICAGSSLFLKNKFGDGYTLNLMGSDKCDVERLMQVCREHVATITLRGGQGKEFTATLPLEPALFAPLLESLSRNKAELGLRHIGLSLTSMEKVFLRVGETVLGSEEPTLGPEHESSCSYTNGSNPDAPNGSTTTNPSYDDSHGSQGHILSSQMFGDDRVIGWALVQQRMAAFLIKRAIYFKRKWLLLISQTLLPVLVTIGCLLMDATFKALLEREPPRRLDLSMFSHTSSLVQADPSVDHLAHHYVSLFQEPYTVSSTNDMLVSLLEEGKKDLFKYRENHVCSAVFWFNKQMRVMYQSIPIHAAGVCTNLITNALLRYAMNSSEYSITTTNRPLPPDSTWKVGSDSSSSSSMVYAMLMPLALALLSASFLVFPLQERETKAKQVQVMTGAPLWALWLTAFIWDYFIYLVSALAIFIVFMIGDSQDFFTNGAAPGALLLLLVLYGWSSIPLAYVFSFLFQTAASGFSALALISILSGMIITTAVWALNLSEQPALGILSDVLNWVTSIVPAYPASMGFSHLVDTSAYNTQCDIFTPTIKAELCLFLVISKRNSSFTPCCDQCAFMGSGECFQKKSYFLFGEDDGMSPDLLTLFVDGCIFFLLLIMIEAGVFRMLRVWARGLCRSGTTSDATERVLDEDVEAESAIVASLMTGDDSLGPQVPSALLVDGLSKRFPGSESPAVNNISFRVGYGECVGLLGVNGAGKTTTFRMLTGDEVPSGGDAKIGTVSLRNNQRKFLEQIGYCPQFDAVLGELTGEEMLTLLGRLRGIKEGCVRGAVSEMVTLVGLTECAKRPSSTYSGGNRRKLSTAMALIGDPPLVFLDEPTSGVDPASRRRVWAAVSQAVSGGQSVVLTSHSMEECEALCSRIIIMSRGTLRCVGTSGHLKAKFEQGYSLQVKLKTDLLFRDPEQYEAGTSRLQSTIQNRLQGALLTDRHQGMLAFRVPKHVSWSHLFFVMEALKNSQDTENTARGTAGNSLVEDYAASDTSLEQVFLFFAREADANLDNAPNQLQVTRL